MKTKIPDKFMGISTKEAYESFVERTKNKELDKDETKDVTKSLSVPADIKLEDYIQIPNTYNLVISKYEPDEFKGLKWEETHFKLHENGLFMPSPALFMPYFLNVIEAHKGKRKLYDGAGKVLDRNEIEDIYKHLTTNHINGGAWAWLNSKFSKDNQDKWYIETANVVNDKLEFDKSSLEACLTEDCYIDFNSLNKQGLPIRKSTNQEYKQGENIYYWHPRADRVARFNAYSDGAYLGCDGDPAGSGSSLGVFTCAEGTQRKK